MRLPLLILLIMHICRQCVVECMCRDTDSCVERVKAIMSAPRRFWFGEQRAAQCSHRNAKNVECGGPPQLANFHSIGNRLFRVKTYHSAYLRNLELFPRVTYRAAPGHYRACEHDFFSDNTSAVEVDPDMEPVDPFRIRKRPEISWNELQFDDQYTILFTDVGYGTLNYLIVDFPKNTKTLKEYEPSVNFRPNPNPMVVLVFRKSRKEIEKPKNFEDFDLTKFMMSNELEDDLVGLSIIVSGSDPFAIEKQRVAGKLDYCHSLLLKKLAHPSSSLSHQHKILQKLPVDEIDTWITVEYRQQHLSANVCCQKIKLPETTVTLDPLGDTTISALSTFELPTFSSLRMSSAMSSNYVNYHRHVRNFVELTDEKFAIAIVDANHGHLHYLQVDIPAVNLANSANLGGITKAQYLPLIPKKPTTCNSYLFLLFAQQNSLKEHEEYCEGWCEKRRKFRPDLFKQQNSLRLSAISTVSSCYDLPYAYTILMADLRQNRTREEEKLGYKSKSSSSALSTEICKAFHVSPHHRCPISNNGFSKNFSTFVILLILLF